MQSKTTHSVAATAPAKVTTATENTLQKKTTLTGGGKRKNITTAITKHEYCTMINLISKSRKCVHISSMMCVGCACERTLAHMRMDDSIQIKFIWPHQMIAFAHLRKMNAEQATTILNGSYFIWPMPSMHTTIRPFHR